MSDQIGILEQQVLLAALRLHPNGYGLSIREEIEVQTGRNHSIGAIYTTLDRLRAKGFLKSKEVEGTAERGGRKKLCFTLTAPGQSALRASLCAIGSLLEGTELAGVLS